MLIGEKRFNREMDESFHAIETINERVNKLTRIVVDQDKHIKLLNMAHKKMISTMVLQDKKIINLVEIIRLLTSDKDRELVIATTKDGTELSVGDFLDAEDLYPVIEEEFNVASFIKRL